MHAFSFLKPHLDWLEAACAKGLDDDESLRSGKGWPKVWARMELVMAAERSVRRGPQRTTHCIYGPRGKCPPDLPFLCEACCRMARAKELAA